MKKACISDNLNPLIDPVFANPEIFDWLALCGATLGYSVQIYCDFSGYSDMAIATAALLGYTLCENFRFPYFSNGVREFWQRWHISLSTWLRDYLYIPLGGNRCSRNRHAINLMITMTLGGLWHGSAWSFLLWGALHGVALVVAHFWPTGRPDAVRRNRISVLAGCLATFVFVSLLWVIFRVPQLDRAWLIIWSLVTFSSPGEYGMGNYLWWFLAVFITCHTMSWRSQRLSSVEFGERHATRRRSISTLTSRLSEPLFWLLLGAGVAVALSFANRQVKPFIYFQF
jgi:alginate O-acetyltransferase complex protein AlgI